MAQGSGQVAQLGIADETYTNEVQRISGTPSGTFGLIFDGYAGPETLATNASATAIRDYLRAFPNIGADGVSATGGALPTAVDITFDGAQTKGRDVPALAVVGSVTGLTFSTPTPGRGYGDYVAPDRFYEFKSEGITEQRQVTRSTGIRAGARGNRSDRRHSVSRGASGSASFDVLSKGYSKLLQHCVGKAPVITTPAGATLARDHTFTPGDFCDLSMTVQKGVPRQQCQSGNVDPFSATGALVTSFSVSGAVDGLLELAIELDAQQITTAQALAAVSYPASSKTFHWTQLLLRIDGANAAVTQFSAEHNANLNVERYRQKNTALKRRPIPEGLLDLTGTLGMDYDGHGRAVYDKFVAGSPAQLVALWRGDQIEAAGGGFWFEFEYTIPAVLFTGETATVDGPGLVMQELPWEAEEDGTNPLFTVRYRTTDTAV